MMAGAGATAIMATAVFAAEFGQQPPGQGSSIAILSEAKGDHRERASENRRARCVSAGIKFRPIGRLPITG